ncbi:hypothetical protein DFR86_00130 [Acidianus sulfidivorans JP7]|uniref:Uncharacterized protein n=1 Tax=Acidianus sulfidivorans JP7 TaxID=619593 RepID=A0A2U9IJ89_9CREN|nr:hypothetical protein [Acidianus sulfidivorans]AWR96112.1 hypothetical protein DFR86_00130 [Acidianus sulfidivorans JP7]
MIEITIGKVFVMISNKPITDCGNLVISFNNPNVYVIVFPYPPDDRMTMVMDISTLNKLVKNLELSLNTTAKIGDYGENRILTTVLNRLRE